MPPSTSTMADCERINPTAPRRSTPLSVARACPQQDPSRRILKERCTRQLAHLDCSLHPSRANRGAHSDIGVTNCSMPARRHRRSHRAGIGMQFTKRSKVQLTTRHDSNSTAILIIAIQSRESDQSIIRVIGKINLIERENPQWLDLYERRCQGRSAARFTQPAAP